MMTKEQEKAKVKEMFAGLEKGSYIEMTIRGADKIILENIENDSAINLVEDTQGYASKAKELEKEIKKLEKEVEGFINLKDIIARERDQWINSCNKWKKIAEENETKIFDLENNLQHEKMESAQKDLEIMQLKAKLYDLMTKGQ